MSDNIEPLLSKLSVLSSPSSGKVASASKARSPRNYLAKDVAPNITVDLQDSKMCKQRDFDRFLQYFLSLCLNGEKKTEYDTIQSAIEKLQTQRYVGAKESPVDPKETELIKKRDALLQTLLEQCLTRVLDVANDESMKELLKAFEESLQEVEVESYEPYLNVCNKAYELLAKLDSQTDAPRTEIRSKLRSSKPCNFRNKAPFDLCEARSDPKIISTTYQDENGVSINTERKPDLIRTSSAAANAVRPGNSEPKFKWYQVLSCTEMKRNRNISSAAKDALKPGALFDTERKIGGDVDDKELQNMTTSAPSTNKSATSSLSKLRSPDTLGVNNVSRNNSSGKRSRVDSQNDGRSEKKRSRTALETSPTSTTDASRQADVQLAGYAMEMLSYGVGVHHVINTLITGEYLTIWYYDRQGIIKSNCVSFIADFPRILVLLFAFQRFSLEDWGVIPSLNPDACRGLAASSEPVAPHFLSLKPHLFEEKGYGCDKSLGDSITLERVYLSPHPHTISGRATSVLQCVNDDMQLACKISNPEVQRPNEGDMLALIDALCTEKDETMKKCVPTVYFRGDLKGCFTLRVRSVLGLDARGFRALRILVLQKLTPITQLKGREFVKALFDVVTCHVFLWRYGIEHGDPSLWNIMYSPTDQCGVLTDFDLSTVQWLERIHGNQRTGTVPFMAIDLLKKAYWDGKLTRYYHHELEAFLWALLFVCLCYEGGKRVSPSNVPGYEMIGADFTNQWLDPDFDTVRSAKLNFLSRNFLTEISPMVTPDFSDVTTVFKDLYTLTRRLIHKSIDNLEQTPVPTEQDHLDFSAEYWTSFSEVLKSPPFEFLETAQINNFEKYKPVFDDKVLKGVDFFEEMRVLHKKVLGCVEAAD